MAFKVLVTRFSKSWNGPKPEPVGPGSMLSPQYINPKPDKPAGFFESPTRPD